MNVLNRIIVVAALVAVMVGVTVTCLFPDLFIDQLALIAGWFQDAKPLIGLADRLILIGVAAAVDIVLLLLVAVEMRRWGSQQVRVHKVEGGAVSLTVDSIRKRLAFYVDGVAGVVNVSPKVQIKAEKVAVSVDVLTAAGVNVPIKAQEIISVIRMVIEETLGLELMREPDVRIRTTTFQGMPPRAAPETSSLALASAPAPERAAEEGPAPTVDR